MEGLAVWTLCALPPRIPDHIGVWLALTGARIKAADCELLGIATDYIASADVERFKAGLIADPCRGTRGALAVAVGPQMASLDVNDPPTKAKVENILGRLAAAADDLEIASIV